MENFIFCAVIFQDVIATKRTKEISKIEVQLAVFRKISCKINIKLKNVLKIEIKLSLTQSQFGENHSTLKILHIIMYNPLKGHSHPSVQPAGDLNTIICNSGRGLFQEDWLSQTSRARLYKNLLFG